MEFIVLLFIFSTLCLSKCSPVAAGTNGEVVSTENPFIVGDVNACQRLPTSCKCSKWIDYEIPASIVAIADIIEYDIIGKVMEREIASARMVNSNCSGLMEAMCAYRFPRCEGSNVVMRSLPDCEQKTRSCVPDLVEVEGICSLNATVPLDSCAAVSSYPVWSEFQRCSMVDSNTRVTAWMMKYMNLTDHELRGKLETGTRLSSLHNPARCVSNTTLYFCQFYGHCTDSGTIELIHSRERCESFINCYFDMTKMGLTDTINCSLWPSASDRPKPVTPQPTNSPGSASSVSSSSSRPRLQPTWPSPKLTFGHGVSLHHCVTGTISIIVLALFSSVFLS